MSENNNVKIYSSTVIGLGLFVIKNHSSGEALTKDTSCNAAPSMMGWHDVRSQKATAGEGVIQTVGAASCQSVKQALFLLCLVSARYVRLAQSAVCLAKYIFRSLVHTPYLHHKST